jgi:PAS domain S-box-containing protein
MIPVMPPAQVEVDNRRRYIAVNDAACELLGYSREEFLNLSIDDISFPSGAHVDPMFMRFLEDGSMSGIFALRRKSGEGIMIRFVSEVTEGRSLATWTHYSPITESPLGQQAADRYGLGEAELK